uniref:Cl2158_1 n=1 Tax=Arundo donax TaxID=35708 RepID=A0A0A9FW62_ARUDO
MPWNPLASTDTGWIRRWSRRREATRLATE